MADKDPYSAIGEGFTNGMGLVTQLASAKLKQQEGQREAQKMKFDEMRKNLDVSANVLKSDAPANLRQAAANSILGMYKTHAADFGIDPTGLPEKVTFDDATSEHFANKILSMNKLYEKTIIGKNDYRVGMFQLAEDYKNMTGKENPNIMKTADEVAQPDRKIIKARIGTNDVTLQETAPGSGQFMPMQVGGQPVQGSATQRVEVVKPPTEGEREKLTTFTSDIRNLQGLKDEMPTGLTGPINSKFTSVKETMDTLSPEDNKWLAKLDLQESYLKKFFAGTAQSKQELASLLKSVPNRRMPKNKLTGSIDASIENYKNKYDTMRQVLLTAGVRDPGALPMDIQLKMFKDAMKKGKVSEVVPPPSGGRPTLSSIFFSADNPETEVKPE